MNTICGIFDKIYDIGIKCLSLKKHILEQLGSCIEC